MFSGKQIMDMARKNLVSLAVSLHMFLVVEHCLIKMRHAPALRNVKGKGLGKKLPRPVRSWYCAGNETGVSSLPFSSKGR